jgi:lipid-A-disaccharide synthase
MGTKPMKLFLIAGEPSGDRLGASLMAGLKTLEPSVEFAGIGGPLMQAEGLQSLFPMEELSVMGIAEVLPKYRALKRRIAQSAAAALAYAPAAMITIDSPDFCLRVAKIVKHARPTLRTIHYVAPSVWAWRPGRAAKMAKVIDHVMALLPFEPPYMTAAGMTCDFVGHPVVSDPVATPAGGAQFRADYGIAPDVPLLLVLPGSRRGEITRLAPHFGGVVAQVIARHPSARILIPTVQSQSSLVQDLTKHWQGQPVYLNAPSPLERAAAFTAADMALAASGTVSLELAAQSCPMVIAYDLNPVTYWLMRRMMLVGTVTLVNLVTNTRTVPEFLGKRCRAELITPAVLHLLANGGEQLDAMRLTMQRLGQGSDAPGLRAARSVLSAL